MPRRAMRPCAQPGCGEIVAPGVSRCPVHARSQSDTKRRDPEQARYYGSARWKKLRATVRREEPVCRICKEGRTTNVDHIDGDWHNEARNNLRGLCTPCERSRTGRQHQAKAGGESANFLRSAPPPAPKSDFSVYGLGK